MNEPLAVGQITWVHGVHTDFMKLISKQQLEEKARQRHEDSCRKGMRNAISVVEEERVGTVYIHIRCSAHQPSCLFNFKRTLFL